MDHPADPDASATAVPQGLDLQRRLERTVASLLANHRSTGRPEPLPFWEHDRSPRRRHRQPDRPPRWRGWVVGRCTDGDLDGDHGNSAGRSGSTDSSDLVLTIDGGWLRSPRVLSVHGRRFAVVLPVPLRRPDCTALARYSDPGAIADAVDHLGGGRTDAAAS